MSYIWIPLAIAAIALVLAIAKKEPSFFSYDSYLFGFAAAYALALLNLLWGT
jgi:xanthine/uracil permease